MGSMGVYDRDQHLNFLRGIITSSNLGGLLDIHLDDGAEARIVKHMLVREKRYGFDYKEKIERVVLSSVLNDQVDHIELVLAHPQFRKSEYLFCDVEWQLRRLLVKIDEFIDEHSKSVSIELDISDISESDFLLMATLYYYEMFNDWLESLAKKNPDEQRQVEHRMRPLQSNGFGGRSSVRYFNDAVVVDSAVKPRNDVKQLHYYIRMCSLLYSIKNRLLYPAKPREDSLERSFLCLDNCNHRSDCCAMLRTLLVLRRLLDEDIGQWHTVTTPLRGASFVEAVLHREHISEDERNFVATGLHMEGGEVSDNMVKGVLLHPSNNFGMI